MESSLSEFIALICYTAERKGIARRIPEGLIDKILAIACQNLNIRIEGLETYVSVRGPEAEYKTPSLVIRPKPIHLKTFSSKYISKEKVKNNLLFKHTTFFESNFDLLCEKEYIPYYENVISELLDIWHHPKGFKKGFQGLVFISILHQCDGGAYYLIGDLETAFRHISDFYWKHLYDPKSFKEKEGPKTITKKIESALAAFDEKIDLVKQASEIKNELMAEGKVSITKSKIMQTSKHLPENSYFWEIFVRLRDFIHKVGIGLVDTYARNRIRKRRRMQQELPFQVGPIAEEFRKNLTTIRKVTNKEVDSLKRLNMDKLFEELKDEVTKYLRSLIGHYDEAFFRKYEANLPSDKLNMTVVYFDIRGSTIGDQILYDDQTKKPEYDRWFTTITSIPKNWFILFGGKISERKESTGDKLVGYFNNQMNAIYSASIVAYHLDMLDRIKVGHFRYKAKIAIGQGDVFAVGGQERGLIIDYLAHMVNKLVDVDILSVRGSDVRVLQDFYENYKLLFKEFVDEKNGLVSKDGVTAFFLDYGKVVESFLETFIG